MRRRDLRKFLASADSTDSVKTPLQVSQPAQDFLAKNAPQSQKDLQGARYDGNPIVEDDSRNRKVEKFASEKFAGENWPSLPDMTGKSDGKMWGWGYGKSTDSETHPAALDCLSGCVFQALSQSFARVSSKLSVLPKSVSLSSVRLAYVKGQWADGWRTVQNCIDCFYRKIRQHTDGFYIIPTECLLSQSFVRSQHSFGHRQLRHPWVFFPEIALGDFPHRFDFFPFYGKKRFVTFASCLR